MRTSAGFRIFIFLITGLILGALFTSPVGAHISESVRHLWTDHIQPLVKDNFYTKSQSNKRFIKKSSTRRGFISCPSTAWYPGESDDTYWTTDAGKRYSTTPLISEFYCHAAFPHGAKDRSVRFSLHDAVSPDFIGCALVRRNLTTHNAIQMAVVNTDAPIGDSVQVDKTISQPTIDNKNFVYEFQCAILGDDANIGFYGASAGYTITADGGVAN